MYFIGENGYYEGDKSGFEDIEVTQRPSPYHEYAKGEWVYSAASKRAKLGPLSAWQVRKVLTRYGLRQQIESAINQADQETKDAWLYANEYERTNPLLVSMATMLGMSDDELDTLFEIGVTL